MLTIPPPAGKYKAERKFFKKNGGTRWMLRSDFSDEVKRIAQDALTGKYPSRKA